MKIFFIGLFLSCSISIHAQPSIVGQWQFDISASLNGDNTVKVKYDSLPAVSRARIIEGFESRLYSFNSDGIIEISWLQNGTGRNASGTYLYSSGTNTISVMVSGRETRFNVLVLSHSDLVLEDPSTKGLFRRLHLKRSEQ